MVLDIEKELHKLEEMIEIIDTFIEKAPEGCLKCQVREGNVFYYHQYKNKKTGFAVRKYIKKGNLSLARRLAQKHYYASIRPVIKNNMAVLRMLHDKFMEGGVDQVYDSLNMQRKNLVTPIKGSKEDIIRKWINEKKESNPHHPEHLRFKTEQGEYVRSKSEALIANMLNKHGDTILYRYEQPLKVVIDGKKMIIYPDFTIINLYTGKVTYWEHIGMLDDGKYASDFVGKTKMYMENDLLLGRDILFSFESSDKPIDTKLIKKMILELL